VWTSRTILYTQCDRVSFRQYDYYSPRNPHESVSVRNISGHEVGGFGDTRKRQEALRRAFGFVIETMAADWQRRLAIEESIRWGGDIALGGHEIRIGGQPIPIDSSWTTAYDGELFRASRPGGPIFELPWKEENFFPGLLVFERQARIVALGLPPIREPRQQGQG
jgi:hypothetical protein